jgi:chromosome segregation ATPase
MQSNALVQFETWSREESSFRTETDQADRERKHTEETLSQLRLQQKQLSNDARESSDLLGRFHRERDLLQQEKGRLQRQLAEERAMLEQCARSTKEVLSEETSSKKAFSKEVDSLSVELAESLSQQEVLCIQSMLYQETAKELREFLFVLMKNGNTDKYLVELDSSLKAWMEAAACYGNFIKERADIMKTVELASAPLPPPPHNFLYEHTFASQDDSTVD